MAEEHLAKPFQRYIVCWYRITLSLLGGDLRFYWVRVTVRVRVMVWDRLMALGNSELQLFASVSSTGAITTTHG